MPLHPKLFNHQRDTIILKLIVDGNDTEDVIRWIMQEYDIKRRTAEYHFYRVRAKLIEGKEDPEILINTHTIRYEDLYKKARDLGWNAIAMKVMKAKEKLLGIDKKIEESVNVVNNRLVLNGGERYDMQGKLSDGEYRKFQELIGKVKNV